MPPVKPLSTPGFLGGSVLTDRPSEDDAVCCSISSQPVRPMYSTGYLAGGVKTGNEALVPVHHLARIALGPQTSHGMVDA